MTKFKVEGMTCGHCIRAVTEAVQGVAPAARVEVDLATGTVTTDSTAAVERLIDAIGAEGYPATVSAPGL